jgi:hypothetical protein
MATARSAIEFSLTEYRQQLHQNLAKQIDQSTHVTQGQVLEQIARRFSKYKLATRAQSKSIKVALALLRTWTE